jgi:laccase
MQLEPSSKATVVRRFRHGAVVDMVFQSTAMLQGDSNPMHLHGHDMFLLAEGLGNYDAAKDMTRFNLVNPPVKNTVLVPNLGWAAIRFVANNPGAYFARKTSNSINVNMTKKFVFFYTLDPFKTIFFEVLVSL